jgi:BAT2 N-terminus
MVAEGASTATSSVIGTPTAGAAAKKSFASKNLNSLTKAPAPTHRAGDTRYGGGRLLVLGKVRQASAGIATAPVPVNTPSLRRENNGQDINVSLVPTGGPGWGAAKEEPAPPPEPASSRLSSTISAPKVVPWAVRDSIDDDRRRPSITDRDPYSSDRRGSTSLRASEFPGLGARDKHSQQQLRPGGSLRDDDSAAQSGAAAVPLHDGSSADRQHGAGNTSSSSYSSRDFSSSAGGGGISGGDAGERAGGRWTHASHGLSSTAGSGAGGGYDTSRRDPAFSERRDSAAAAQPPPAPPARAAWGDTPPDERSSSDRRFDRSGSFSRSSFDRERRPPPGPPASFSSSWNSSHNASSSNAGGSSGGFDARGPQHYQSHSGSGGRSLGAPSWGASSSGGRGNSELDWRQQLRQGHEERSSSSGAAAGGEQRERSGSDR